MYRIDAADSTDKRTDAARIAIMRSQFRTSFKACYLLLFGTALITFIEAMRVDDPHVRHILNLETAVSLTAGFVYSIFDKMANDETKQFNMQDIMYYRYIDWLITTPMLLLVLILFMTFHTKDALHFSSFVVILGLNNLMLLCGYMSEKQKQYKSEHPDTPKPMYPWTILGFVAFASMIATIYYLYLTEEKNLLSPHMIVFYVFTAVWTLYGVAAELDDFSKNMMYNGLDMIAKVFFGIGLWGYYGGVIQW